MTIKELGKTPKRRGNKITELNENARSIDHTLLLNM